MAHGNLSKTGKVKLSTPFQERKDNPKKLAGRAKYRRKYHNHIIMNITGNDQSKY